MSITDEPQPASPYNACPNRPLNLTVTAKGMPTHAQCPSTWLCEKRGCQFKPSAIVGGDDKSLFESVFGKRW